MVAKMVRVQWTERMVLPRSSWVRAASSSGVGPTPDMVMMWLEGVGRVRWAGCVDTGLEKVYFWRTRVVGIGMGGGRGLGRASSVPRARGSASIC